MPSKTDVRRARRLANLELERAKEATRQAAWRAAHPERLRPLDGTEPDSESVTLQTGRLRDVAEWVIIAPASSLAERFDEPNLPTLPRFGKKRAPADVAGWGHYFRLLGSTDLRRAAEVARALANEPRLVREMARRIRARPWQSGIELYGVQTAAEALAALERLDDLGLLRRVESDHGRVGYEVR